MSESNDWNICPQWKTNFECTLTNTGKWRLEKKETWGKWLLLIKPKSNNTCPTFGDQRNFFTGLFEAEWRNDNHIFEDGIVRPPQREKKIQMFKDILDEMGNRASVKDTKKGLNYYIKVSIKKENDKST